MCKRPYAIEIKVESMNNTLWLTPEMAVDVIVQASTQLKALGYAPRREEDKEALESVTGLPKHLHPKPQVENAR